MATQRLNGTLGYGAPTGVVAPAAQSGAFMGSATGLPRPGQVVYRGQALYELDEKPVILLYGSVPDWRLVGPGASGQDVKQLEQNLLALGFATPSDLAADGTYTTADEAAIKRWQAALGLLQTGTVLLGQVIFEPGPVRVVDLRSSLGSPASGLVMDVTSVQHVVSVQVPVQYQEDVHVGDAVSVLMPDGHTTVRGSVTDVGRVAAASSSSSQGQGGQSPSQPATLSDTVTLASEAVAGNLDEAPVFVTITTAVDRGVLAVPVTALQAQPDGSYAVAVRSRAHRRLVRVEPGIFDDRGLVEVSGQGLEVGERVEVPAP
jgi:peptidoglycan hydrolase-like protein with peptidoglycan-binding domain